MGQGKVLEFEKTTVEYLRVIISHNLVAMDPVKVAGVADWPEPTSKKEVQSFLGFTNFYQCFIKDFSEHARLLFDLTKNDVKWHWGTDEQSVFDRLKQNVTTAPVITSPDSTQPLCIEADSSNFATRAVLSQVSPEDGNGTRLPFSLNPFPRLSITMKYMTKRCSPSSDPYKNGDIS
jgi:hypothetical protein